MKTKLGLVAVGALVALVGCGPLPPDQQPDGGHNHPTDGGNPPADGGTNVPDIYEFNGRGSMQSSVAYTGQTLRHVLIEDLKTEIGNLTALIDNNMITPAQGTIVQRLDFYYELDMSGADVAPLLSTTPAPLQTKYSEIGSANLTSKIAGNDDPQKQHKNWATDLKGWAGATSPEGLVRDWFGQIEQLAIDRANGTIPMDPSGMPISKVHVTADGVDLQQIIQKFLGGAISLSQAADDYLDEGLDADHSMVVSGKTYTNLEHQWDEGFGYFGASRDYLLRTDAEVSSSPAFDSNGDGKIDLLTEYSYGHSQNAAKRDNGSAATAPTHFSEDAMKAFLAGRALLASTNDALSAEQKAKLVEHRDAALLAWEKAIAASAVHYINDVLGDMNKFNTAEYKFLDHAKHWSELKGFALSLQFNPHSPLTDAQFDELHQKLGDKPVLPNAANPADIAAYKTALREARAILGTAYGFDAANLGDDNGQNGW